MINLLTGLGGAQPTTPLSTAIDVAGGLQGLQYNNQVMQQQQQQAGNEQKMRELAGRYAKGDTTAIADMFSVDPKMGMVFQQEEQRRIAEKGAQHNEQVKKATTDFFVRLKGTPKEQWAQMAEEALTNDMIDVNPQRAQAIAQGNDFVVDVGLAGYLGADAYKQIFGGEKKQPFQQGTGDMSGYVFDPNTGQYSINPELKSRIDAAKQTGDLDPKTRLSINKDISQLTANTRMIHNTAADLEKLSKVRSGPAAIAMVFKFMKALDPTSVVREGEFATAENAAGVPAQISNLYNKLMEGERLGDKQIEEFVSAAKLLANSAIDNSSPEIESYLNTFEDTLPESFKKSVKGRIPTKFEVQEQKPNPDDPLGLLF